MSDKGSEGLNGEGRKKKIKREGRKKLVERIKEKQGKVRENGKQVGR